MDNSREEGVGSVAQSELKDLATGFLLKARPLIILHNLDTDDTVTIKLKRGLLKHSLIVNQTNKGDRVVAVGVSSIVLITKALNEARKWLGRGYVEI